MRHLIGKKYKFVATFECKTNSMIQINIIPQVAFISKTKDLFFPSFICGHFSSPEISLDLHKFRHSNQLSATFTLELTQWWSSSSLTPLQVTWLRSLSVRQSCVQLPTHARDCPRSSLVLRLYAKFALKPSSFVRLP